MKICNVCGKELGDDVQFCPVCGSFVGDSGESSRDEDTGDGITPMGEESVSDLTEDLPDDYNPENSNDVDTGSSNYDETESSYGENTESSYGDEPAYSGESYYEEDVSNGSRKKLQVLGIIAAVIIIAGGIVGYYFYVQSAKKAALLHQSEVWDDYLKLTPEGQVINAIGKGLQGMSNSEFREYGFENYVAGKLEGKEVDIDDISALMDDLKIEISVSPNMKSLLSESLYKKYEKSNYDGWNPVDDLFDGQYIVITGIDVSGKEKSAVVSYILDDTGDDLEMVLKKESSWKVTEFRKDGQKYVN